MSGSSLPSASSGGSSSLDAPASQLTAQVIRHSTHVDAIRLPERLARETVLRYTQRYDPTARVIMGPADFVTLGLSLTADQWAIEVSRAIVPHLGFVFSAESIQGPVRAVMVYRRHTILIARTRTQYILLSLEKVKPEALEADGRPSPWIPVRRRDDAPKEGEEVDAFVVPDGAELPPMEGRGAGSRATLDAAGAYVAFIEDSTIARWFGTLSAMAGFSKTPELDLVRGKEEKNGFTAGRVWFGVDRVPRRVRLVTCPNSDLAEILATMVHELAHPVSGATAHNDVMKATFVGLASRQWGGRYFGQVAGRVEKERIRTVDYWVASGIRAALKGGEPPVAKGVSAETGDDGQMARVMSRLKKLRHLARDQVGKPEGIAATGAANDLVTLYGLGHYGVGDAEIDETQIVDRFCVLPDGAVWRRTLAHAVAEYCEVFSLGLPSDGRMHFFGAYADVVAAEYLFAVSSARIDSDCRDHIAAWKKRRGKTSSAETRKEKTSFCDCAALEFSAKLERIRSDEGESAGSESVRGRQAEEVARHEHAKRGMGWSSSGSKTYRENAAGRAAGAAMEVLRGVGGATKPAGALGHKR